MEVKINIFKILDSLSAVLKLSISTYPFNDGASQSVGSSFFGYTSPAAIARELFKPSTDAARLLGSIKKKFFLIWVRGSPGRGSQSGGVLCFLTYFDGPWTPIQWAKIWLKLLLETR